MNPHGRIVNGLQGPHLDQQIEQRGLSARHRYPVGLMSFESEVRPWKTRTTLDTTPLARHPVPPKHADQWNTRKLFPGHPRTTDMLAYTSAHVSMNDGTRNGSIALETQHSSTCPPSPTPLALPLVLPLPLVLVFTLFSFDV